MNHWEILMVLVSTGCSLASAVLSGFVLWAIDRIFKDVYERIESQDERLGHIETVLMERKA